MACGEQGRGLVNDIARGCFPIDLRRPRSTWAKMEVSDMRVSLMLIYKQNRHAHIRHFQFWRSAYIERGRLEYELGKDVGETRGCLVTIASACIGAFGPMPSECGRDIGLEPYKTPAQYPDHILNRFCI